MTFIYIILVIFVAYSAVLFYFWWSWTKVPYFSYTLPDKQVKVSVIIPARNEEQNIADLLFALAQQDYPRELLEVIVIDDHSEDRTAEIVSNFSRVKLISLSGDERNSFKKSALQLGIAQASGELIVTTDADCIPANTWIATLVACRENRKAICVAAPVRIVANRTVLQVFQSMDFMMLQGITAGAVHRHSLSMANGANLAYDKSAFNEVEGFKNIDHIASGDDMLLVYKFMKKFPGQYTYCKSRRAIITTRPMITWASFFNQRIRWASKARSYEDKRLLPVLAIVYLQNLLFLPVLILGFITPAWWLYFVLLWLAKTFIELPLFLSVSTFYKMKWTLPYFILLQPLHVAYTIISGFLGLFSTYTWKGRKVK